MSPCEKCNGTGHYQYSTHGTPIFKGCEVCCPHDQGWWLLTEGFQGYQPDKDVWCCKSGCGMTTVTEQPPEDAR